MPERIFALFAYVPEHGERIQRMFLDAGMIDQLVQPPPSHKLYKIELPNEAAVQRLHMAALANDVKPPTIHRYLQPTAKELAAAPLLYLSTGGPASERAHPRAGTAYDDSNACPQCGAGLVQMTPLRVRKSEIPKSFLATGIADELIMHESVADVVGSAHLQGIAFRPVLDQDGATIPWRQLVVEETLPPMLASSRGMIRGRSGAERPCERCGRDGWFDTTGDPFLPVYPRTVLESMPDAAWTFEMFGTGAWGTPVHGKRWLARRRLIVRPSMFALLKPLKVRGVRWSPVLVQ